MLALISVVVAQAGSIPVLGSMCIFIMEGAFEHNIKPSFLEK